MIPAPLRPEAISPDRYAITNTGNADQRDVVFGGQFLARAYSSSMRAKRTTWRIAWRI